MSEHKIEEGVIKNAEVLVECDRGRNRTNKENCNACVLEKNVTPELISQKIKEIRNYGKIKFLGLATGLLYQRFPKMPEN